jgi:hypothetical protein
MNRYYVFFAVLFLLAGASPAQSQNWGIGLRLGDPSGLTLKKYMAGKALELSIGRTHFWYGKGWYDKKFYKWYDDRKFGYKDLQYNGYKASAALAVQVHYLIQKPFGGKAAKSAAGLEGYYGLGGQMRFRNYYYDYRYKPEGSNAWVYVPEERVVDFDLGVDAVGGLEYTFRNTPASLFTDLTLFMEVVDDPFVFWWQFGLGARYRF